MIGLVLHLLYYVHQVVFQAVGVVDTVSTWPEEVINDGSSMYVKPSHTVVT